MHLKCIREQISAESPAAFEGLCFFVVRRERTGEDHRWEGGKKDEMDERISEGGWRRWKVALKVKVGLIVIEM